MEREGPDVIEIQEHPVEMTPRPGERAYFATLIAGLEGIVVDEIRERLPGAIVFGAMRGKVFFCSDRSPDEVSSLLSVENVFAYSDQLAELPRSEDGLTVIERWLVNLDLRPALDLHARLHGPHENPSFRITASRSGEHQYNSLQIAASAGAGVVARYGWEVDLEDYDYDVRVYVTDDTAVAGVRLTPEALHQRARVRHGAASLNATVAHAMCRLTRPTDGQVVLDPMCGAGTLLVERARLPSPRLMIGADLFAEPLDMARANVEAAGVEAALINWDARQMCLARGTVDVVVCNMPWGRRIGSHRVNRHLYPGFVRELERVLVPGGIAALLTQEKRLITRLLGRADGLKLVREDHLSLSGTHPAIYLV
ncbi:MAG: methyltransferase domain-containing protein, partial [Armatimonadia bacterium]|nr:methyltransferase domain-containing protein [Armatimonadia bacterium]